MDEKVYKLLRLSFDSLPNGMVRSCLLYCSLFPEDYQIRKDTLIDIWIGEGFMDEHNYTSQARNQGHHIIGCLIRACLLEEVTDWIVKMHDLIRDMSLWIARKCEAEKWKYFVEAGYHLTEMPEVGKWRGIRRMSLMQNKIQNPTQAPNCPDLQTLLLDNNQLTVIQNDFFQFMCGLKVLSLRGNEGIRALPVGISKLVSLEYLDLSFTRIRQLPIELKALEKLKCLILEFILCPIDIPRGLICGFSKLQTLRMLGSFPLKAEGDEFIECLVEELQCLNHLNGLKLHCCIQQIGLQSFSDSKQLNILSLANVKSLLAIQLRGCRTLEEVRTEWEREGRMIKALIQTQISAIATQPCFQSLESVFIAFCSKLRDITWLIVAPNLRHFTVLPFSCMKGIEVGECPRLRGLPLDSNSAKGNKISIKGEEKWWKELEWEDEDTRNAFLPCFIAV